MRNAVVAAVALCCSCYTVQTREERITDATVRVAGAATNTAVGVGLVAAGVFSEQDGTLRPYILMGLGVLFVGTGAFFGHFAREDLLRALNEPTTSTVAPPPDAATPPANPPPTEPSAPPEHPQ